MSNADRNRTQYAENDFSAVRTDVPATSDVRAAFAAEQAARDAPYTEGERLRLAGNDLAGHQSDAFAQNLSSVLSFYQALQSGNEIAAAGASAVLFLEQTSFGATNTTTQGWAAGLGALAAAQNLKNALEHGDTFAAVVAGSHLVYQGASFLSVAAEGALASSAQTLASTLGSVCGVLGIVYALSQGDILGAAVAAVSIAFPVVGLVFALYGLLAADEPPEIRGTAVVRWSEDGTLTTAISEDQHGGGATAQSVLNSVLAPLSDFLNAQRETSSGGPPLYGLVPERLPAVSFLYRATPELILRYRDAQGNLIERHYDASGERRRLDGSLESNLAQDFVDIALRQGAIVPAWEAETIRLRLAQGGDTEAWKPEPATASLPEPLADGLRQALSVLTLSLTPPLAFGLDPERQQLASEAVRRVRFDIDADGYLEASEWVKANQAILVIDRNLDGTIDQGNELLRFVGESASSGSGRPHNSLDWLDANGDRLLDATDPAFAAVKLWFDLNGDARSQGRELLTLAEADIDAIDFRGSQPEVVLRSGERRTLDCQRLVAETEGVRGQVSRSMAVLELEAGSKVYYLQTGDRRLRSAPHETSAYGERLQHQEALVQAAGGLFAASGSLLTGLALGMSAAADASSNAAATASLPPAVDLEQMIAAAREALRMRAERLSPEAQPLAATAPPGPSNTVLPLPEAAISSSWKPALNTAAAGLSQRPTLETNASGASERQALEHNTLEAGGEAWHSPLPIMLPPEISGEFVEADEDVTLIFHPAALLANDVSPNAGARLSVVEVSAATHGEVRLLASGEVAFYPEPNYFGPASFRYTVSDQWGYRSTGEVHITLRSVNDPPVIEAIEYGRPIFGYDYVTSREWSAYWQDGFVYDEASGRYWREVTTLQAIMDEATARSLAASGQLRDASGNPLIPQTYLNGGLRPIGFDSRDATRVTYSDDPGNPVVIELVDDPQRSQGRIIAYDIDSDVRQFTYHIYADPVHGHADVNFYISSEAPENLLHLGTDLLRSYVVPEPGAWQYFSHPYDGYSGDDPFVIAVTDAEGARATYTVHATHYGSSQGGGGKKPVTLDLDGDGLEFVGLDDSNAYFDVNGDGWREHIAWVGAGDGLLVRDLGADGLIQRPEEIAFRNYLPGAFSDLEGLRAFDSNADGKLSALDERFGEFGIWVDANQNGLSEPGEVQTLAEAGISEISLASNGGIEPHGDVLLLGRTQFVRADGTRGAAGDAVFAYDPRDVWRGGPAPSSETEGELVRQAAAFVEASVAFQGSAAPAVAAETGGSSDWGEAGLWLASVPVPSAVPVAVTGVTALTAQEAFLWSETMTTPSPQ